MSVKPKLKKIIAYTGKNFIIFRPIARNILKRNVYKEVERAIDCFVSKEKKEDKRYMRYLIKDVLNTRIFYNCPPDEFFLYEFERLSEIGRHEFVTNIEKENICRKLNNNWSADGVWNIFQNKEQTYKHFSKFYNRDIALISNKDDYNAFCSFVEKHHSFIMKKHNSSKGTGVKIYNIDEYKSEKELFHELLKDGKIVIEELIKQHPTMAEFHPKSINTVRCATVLRNGKVHIITTILRMGSGGSVVDNAGSGGILAYIDTETGIVCSYGFTERNNRKFIHHPDTGKQIIGFQVPEWKKLIETVTELANVIPEQRYVGWDLALTENGWVMVEGNSAAQFILRQLTTKRGIRQEVEELLY